MRQILIFVLLVLGLAFGPMTVVMAQTTVIVDHRFLLADRISSRNFSYVNEAVTAQNFPSSGTGKVSFEPKLFHFDRVMTSEQAIQEMEKEGFRPATFDEVLAYETFTEGSATYPIMALGSVANVGSRLQTPYITGGPVTGRWVSISSIDSKSGAHVRFLGVRK